MVSAYTPKSQLNYMWASVINGADSIFEVNLLIQLSHDATPAAENEAAQTAHKLFLITIYYPYQHLICIETWECSLGSFAVVLNMDRPMFICMIA